MARLRLLFSVLAGLVLAGAAHAQTTATCPAALPSGTTCYDGQDANGAFYWIAIPKNWNHVLVVHTHGGPSLKTPKQDDPVSDLTRFAVTVQEGFAWAGSSYRHAGFGVRDAAADSDHLRQIFWDRFGKPAHTILHGQSWGGNVAAKTAELYGPNYDGVILTSGVLGGGTKSYDFRADLRAVYQYYCHNLPGPDEAGYPLWEGLSPTDTFRHEDVAARINACTGVGLKPAERTASQRRNLDDILNVIHIPERTLVSHMDWATFTFRDLVQRQLRGQNPFSNTGVVYKGSHDDAALNKGVERFQATQAGVDDLADDADLSGKLGLPTLTLHAEDDPTAFVELENAFHAQVVKQGREALLVQSFTDEHEHLKEATPEYAALFEAMLAWIDEGEKPTVAALATRCQTAIATYGEACHFDPGFYPKPLDTRVYDRVKPTPKVGS